MSKTKVDVLANRLDTKSHGVGDIVDGVPKAWVNMNVSATVLDSLNISNTTDIGVGNWSASFTNNFSSADYASLWTQEKSAVAAHSFGTGDTAPTTGVVEYFQVNNAGTPTEGNSVGVSGAMVGSLV